MKSKKIAVTLVSGLLLVLLYGIIFSFSAQDGETSTEISMGVSGSLVGILDFLTFGTMNMETLTELAVFIEHPLRKSAHFLEYALMGILIYSMLYYPVNSGKRRFWISLGWVILSAAADELHQYFVPGRWGSVKDVLLDSCGGLAGVFILHQIVKHIKKKENKKVCLHEKE